MTIGKKLGSNKALKKASAKGSGGAGIQNFPNEGKRIRFLSEPEEWIFYFRYYDNSIRRYVPMVDGEEVPQGARVQERFVACVVDVDKDVVIPVDIAKSLGAKLNARLDRNGTLMDRNFVITRLGDGLDTEYDIESEGESKFNFAKYTALDLGDILMKSRQWALKLESDDDDDDDDDADETPAPAKAKSVTKPAAAAPAAKATKSVAKKAAPAKAKEPSLDDLATMADDDGDEEAQEKVNEAGRAVGLDPDEYGTWAELVEAIREAEEAPVEPAEAPEEESEEITEEALWAMSLKDLRALAKELEVEVETGAKQPDLIQAILALAE